jgi:hypothetical protein
MRVGGRQGWPTALGLACLACLAGCTPPQAAVRTVRLGDGALAQPILEATVRGNPVPLVLDTGAERHFLADSTAWGCGVESSWVDAWGTDAVGRRVSAELATEAVLHVAGIPDDRFDAPGVVFSAALRNFGFWGGIAPQRLADLDERVVIDFRAGRLIVLPEDDGQLAPAGPGAASGTLVHCRLGDGEEGRGWYYLVDARVGGREARLLVDTGASQTVLFDDSEAGRALAVLAEREELLRELDRLVGDAAADDGAPRAAVVRQMWVGGTAEGLEVQGVTVELGRWGKTTPVTLVTREAPSTCAGDGVLGYDLLRFCELSLGPEGGEWRCSDEAPPTAVPEAQLAGAPVRLTAVEAVAACGRTAEELTPEVHGGELPMTYPSYLDACAVLYEGVENHSREIEVDCGERGWAMARVVRPPLVRSGDELRVRFEVDEGPRYRVGAVTIRVVDVHDAEIRRVGLDELPWWRQRPGEWYSELDWTDDRFDLWDAVAAMLGQLDGYRMEVVPDEAAGTVELKVDLVLAPPEAAADEAPE